MKIAFISDIHGNATALEAVLEDIEKKNVDKIAVLGDLCFRGSEPKRALDLIRSLNTDVVKGNADEWVSRGIKEGEVPNEALEIMRKEREWTLKQLTTEDIDFLTNLPTQLTIKLSDDIEIHAFHATPNNLFNMVLPNQSDTELAEQLMQQTSADIFLYGHIHLPYVRFINGKCVANLGSVGLPFDGSKNASYLIVEGEDKHFQVSVHRVSYDVDYVIKQLKEKEYPNYEFLRNVLVKASLS
ncbi:YfcE family phosphodiesterase [Oceanobacillus caeni]|uniref:metallophosphoesterase family protein n=1 Tax=Oceanobacillus TaxID=182709 RepID=UPI00195D1424|nr:YfcE family phosphodiesterase [Oceanobacillus caeni]MBU8789407.1 YfcE family phosphodiesterase [Oceanobacillus caeni]MCR1832808.1 YfcE family phosphodiesterase [Oceanobacillus caeni]